MSSTDLSGVASAASRIQIEGPPSPAGKIDLTDTDLTQVMPGELDERVGTNDVPPMRVATTPGRDGEPPVARVVEDEPIAITIDMDAPDVDQQIAGAAREVVRRANPDALFDTEAFDVVPRVDGQATDVLEFTLSGAVKYEATDDDGRELFEALRLGKFVVLRVTGVVASRQGRYKENAEGDSIVTGKTVVKIDSINLRAPEDLG